MNAKQLRKNIISTTFIVSERWRTIFTINPDAIEEIFAQKMARKKWLFNIFFIRIYLADTYNIGKNIGNEYIRKH